MPTDKLKVKRISVVGFCLVLLLPVSALADILTAKIIKITDVDSLYVLDVNYEQHKIRLAGIDAPSTSPPNKTTTTRFLNSKLTLREAGHAPRKDHCYQTNFPRKEGTIALSR